MSSPWTLSVASPAARVCGAAGAHQVAGGRAGRAAQGARREGRGHHEAARRAERLRGPPFQDRGLPCDCCFRFVRNGRFAVAINFTYVRISVPIRTYEYVLYVLFEFASLFFASLYNTYCIRTARASRSDSRVRLRSYRLRAKGSVSGIR